MLTYCQDSHNLLLETVGIEHQPNKRGAGNHGNLREEIYST